MALEQQQSGVNVKEYLKESNISHLYNVLESKDVHHQNTLLFLNEKSLSDLCDELKFDPIEKLKFIATIKRMQHEHFKTLQIVIDTSDDIKNEEQNEEKKEELLYHGADRFSFIRELAQTLQGRIYLTMDKNTNKHCVVKEAWKDLVHSGRSRSNVRVAEDFVRERKILMQLTSEGAPDSLIRGIDEWDDEKCYFVVMESCNGELFEYINSVHRGKEYKEYTLKQCHPLKEQQALKRPNKWIKSVTFMFRQLCEGVSWMHEHGYCHLDLSLENTMLAGTDSHRIKIIDYGLTQHFENGDFSYNARVGKVSYMCPEAYARKKYDARAADIYCLGIILFMMLVGAPIYQYPIKTCAPFHYCMSGRLNEILIYWKRLSIVTEDALDLLNKILRYEDNGRITMKQIFEHPFMNVEEEDVVNEEEKQVVEIIKEKEEENDDESVHGLDSEDDDDNKYNDESVHGLDSEENEEEVDAEKVIALKEQKEDEQKQKQLLKEDDEKTEIDEKIIMDEIEKKYDKLFIDNMVGFGEELAQFLLVHWNLADCFLAFKSSGWVIPGDWDQLTIPVLVYEVGIEKEQAQTFLENLGIYLKYRRRKVIKIYNID